MFGHRRRRGADCREPTTDSLIARSPPMPVRVGINGFGRIGRLVYRAMVARPNDFEVVAINDLADPKHLAVLLRYDTVHGRFDGKVEASEGALNVNGHPVKILAEREPAKLPWKD